MSISQLYLGKFGGCHIVKIILSSKTKNQSESNSTSDIPYVSWQRTQHTLHTDVK